MTNAEEFFNTVALLKKDYNVRIFVYKNKKSFPDKEARGIAYFYKKPYKISVMSNGDYTDMLITLLHEMGHLLDISKNKHTARIKLFLEVINKLDSLSELHSLTKQEKVSHLHSELMAEKQIPYFVEKYALNLSKTELKIQTYRYIEDLISIAIDGKALDEDVGPTNVKYLRKYHTIKEIESRL